MKGLLGISYRFDCIISQTVRLSVICTVNINEHVTSLKSPGKAQFDWAIYMI